MAIQTVKATVNGAEYSLTYNSTSGKWEASLTAPSTSSYTKSGGYYGVKVVATDTAGNATTVDQTNGTLGTSLRLVVKEKVKPTITIVNPGAGSYITNNKPSITIQLRDNDSGINISTLSVKVDSGSAVTNTSTGVTCTSVSGGYDVTYVPQTALGDGAHTITVNISDNDGNAADAATRSFTVDTLPPSLNVSTPADGLITNVSAGTIAGTTNDELSSPVTVTIKLNNVDQGTVTVSSGSFSKAVTYAEGTNTIIVTATDSLGQATTITRTVTLDTVPPTISAIELVPNPVDAGATYIIKVTAAG
ncbi:MAG: Ig-like domain-containing protein [Bacillota bacterium]|nr:Ig-like domain-containing protein [Bacillota bacterium]